MAKKVLAFSCPHEPFADKGYFPFIKRIYKETGCTDIVCLGDIVDNHAISYHEHDPDGWSPEQEMREVDKKLRKWFKEFPHMRLCLGNHDRLVDRKGKTVGLPSRCFKSFSEMWNLPKTWKVGFEFIINDVKYVHGTGYSGKYGHVQASYDNRMSTVIGHLHSVAGVEYIANSKDIIFGMCCGCGIDRKAYAFEYGQAFKRKPILGCGVVSYTSKGTNASFYPMEMK